MNLLSASSPLGDFLLRHRVKVRFVLVGIWNTIFGYLVFLVLDILFASAFSRRYVAYMTAMVLSNVLTITNAYIFHKYVTFKSSVRGKGIVSEVTRFAMTYGLTIGLSLLLLPVLVEILGIGPKTAAALVILICTMVSWIGHSRFSFGSSTMIHSEEDKGCSSQNSVVSRRSLEQAGLARETKIDLISLIVLSGFVASVFLCYFRSAYLGLGYPFNTFLLQPADRFMDYFNGLTYATAGYGAGMAGMGGVAYLLFHCFYLISFKNANLSFTVYTLLIAMYVTYYNFRNLSAGTFSQVSRIKLVRSLFILSFLSYPVLFTLDRGNAEAFAFIFLSLFVYFLSSNRAGISALFLAAATALKVYPAVFVIIYFAQKKYRVAFIFVSVLLLLSGFTYDNTMGINFHLTSFVSAIRTSGDPAQPYNALYVIGDEGAAFSSSAYGALKAAMYAWDPLYSSNRLLKLFSIYYRVSFLLFALVALYVVIIEKELWKKVAILTLSMILFPFVTGDYKLLNLYIPMWLFVNSEEKSREDLLYSVLFALLLIPKAYYFIKGDISISVMLNPLILSIFLLSIIAVGLSRVSVTDIKYGLAEHVTAIRNLYKFRRIYPTG